MTQHSADTVSRQCRHTERESETETVTREGEEIRTSTFTETEIFTAELANESEAETSQGLLKKEPREERQRQAGDNRLPELASQIRKAHADVQDAATTAAKRALDAGAALVEAKALCRHGEWLPFLADSGVQERTAQRYMTLARSNLQSDTVSLLGGVMPALRFLRLRKHAYDQLTEAWDAARDGRTGADELVPLETALMLMDEMVSMFPDNT